MTDAHRPAPPLAAGRFFGELHQSLSLPDAWLSETHYPGGFTVESHAHEHAFLCLVVRGRYTEFSGSTRRECQPFTAIFHPPGETHSDRFHSPGACFNVELTLPVPGGRDALSAATLAPGSCIPFLAARLYVAFRRQDRAAATLAEELVLELDAPSTRGVAVSRHPPSWLPRALAELEASDSPMGIRALAARLSLHPVYLARAFRRHVGCSPTAYRRRARLTRAVARLASGVPTSRIAAEAGFADQSHFHRGFHRAMGLAPGRWRALIRCDTRRQVAPVQDGTHPAG
jgi:AraC family transcriptional regulator